MNNRYSARRGFLKGIIAAAAAPMVVKASVVGRDGRVSPSNRITVGGIGLGGRGQGELCGWVLPDDGVQFVAICDVRRDRRNAIKRIVDNHYHNTDCVMYRDMKDILARPDIDAVLIATSDRWHASASVLAMRAGKDVYCEKPSSMTVREGQAVVRTAKKYGRVYQAGMQRLSEANFIVCNELLRLGRLGEVKQVYAHLAPGGTVNLQRKWFPAQPEPDRDEVDWDAWLGPCPWRPYNVDYIRGGWHRCHDLYTSIIGEWGSHTFAQCHAALGKTNTSPVRYPYVDHPAAEGMTMEFADGVKMTQTRTGWAGTCGVRYVGSEGWVACADGYSRPEASSPALLSDYMRVLNDYCARTGYSYQNHFHQFLDSVRSRRTTVANPELMHRSMTTVHCANIAQWLKRDLTWDPVKEEFVGDPEANRMLSRAQREGWQII